MERWGKDDTTRDASGGITLTKRQPVCLDLCFAWH